MATAIPRIIPMAFRWQSLLTGTRMETSRFVCRQCQRRKGRREFHAPTALRKKRTIEDEKEYKFSIDELESKDRAEYEALSPKDQEAFRDIRKQMHAIINDPSSMAEAQNLTSQSVANADRDAPVFERERRPRTKPGFWNMGEVEREDSGEDEPFEGDDLPELGHAELEQHREMREYARIAAWEMPLLSKLATPFQPPDPNHVLRFRYTTYMGEEHPAGKKIVLEFCPSDLPDLTPAQSTKLIKLVGVRYNPETKLVKMSSEMFETQAQNKRYLGDLVDTLMAEAKDASDMFEDVPLDFRHHRYKERNEFPEAWKFTPARKKQLEQERAARLESEQSRVGEGKVVNGGEILRLAMEAMPRQDERVAMAQQQRGGRKSGPQRMLR